MKKLSLTLLFCGLFITLYAQRCSYTMPASLLYLDGAKLNLKGGDTLCLEAGTKRYLQLKNLSGDSLHPIVIINKGLVIIENKDFYYGFKLHNCTYIHISGSGDPTQQYGIQVRSTGPRASGLSIGGKSTDFEIDHIEIANTGFAGVLSKTDPQCDGSVNRGVFTQKNIVFHDNYVHDTKGEGFYIGNSFYNGITKNKKCPGDTLYPHTIENLKVFNNKIENSGWEGIQIGCANKNVLVFNNTINGFGKQNKSSQNNGMQIGEGTRGLFYNNYIQNGGGNGIIMLGKGKTVIFNNLIKNTGGSGLFADNRDSLKGDSILILNNTFYNCGQNCIRWFNENTKNYFINNLFIDEKANSVFLFHPATIKKTIHSNTIETDTQKLSFIKTKAGIEVPITAEESTYNISRFLKKYNLKPNKHIGFSPEKVIPGVLHTSN